MKTIINEDGSEVMKSLEALENIITIYSNIVSTNRCAGKTRFEMCVRQIKQDLEVLKILKRFFNEFQPEMEYWIYRKSYTLAINGEINISEEEKDKLEKWLEGK